MSVMPKYDFKTQDLLKGERITLENLNKLKEWLRNKDKLPQMPEEQVGLFLLVCDNDPEYTKITIEHYFKCQSSAPELFTGRDIDNELLSENRKVSKFGMLPKRTKENYVIGFAQLSDTYWYHWVMDPAVKMLFMAFESIYYRDPPNGMIFILNLKDVGLMHLTKLKPNSVKKFFSYLQGGMPARMKKIHIFNCNYVFDKFMSMFKSFIDKDLFSMMVMHPCSMKMEDFFKNHIEAEYMPSDYGGNQLDTDTLWCKLQEEERLLRPFFYQIEKQVEEYKKLNSKK